MTLLTQYQKVNETEDVFYIPQKLTRHAHLGKLILLPLYNYLIAFACRGTLLKAFIKDRLQVSPLKGSKLCCNYYHANLTSGHANLNLNELLKLLEETQIKNHLVCVSIFQSKARGPNGTKYSRMDQVKSVEDSLQFFCERYPKFVEYTPSNF